MKEAQKIEDDMFDGLKEAEQAKKNNTINLSDY